MFDYALGGKDNYSVDREASEKIREAIPTVLVAVEENRRFMRRAVRHLLSVGIRQFLDLGAGMPGRGNVHDLAHAVDPAARVVYVDNDQVIVNHYQALLSSSDVAAALLADIRSPRDILSAPAVTARIDFGRPVAILMTALLHYLSDDEDPGGIADAFVSAVPPGSHLVLSHYHPGGVSEEEHAIAAGFAESMGITMAARTSKEIEGFFGELVLVDPGLVPPTLWRPDRIQKQPTGWQLAGVGRKA
ncbi:SAM-dependent methyltransferase [Actinoallomurus bryophytorum]